MSQTRRVDMSMAQLAGIDVAAPDAGAVSKLVAALQNVEIAKVRGRELINHITYLKSN